MVLYFGGLSARCKTKYGFKWCGWGNGKTNIADNQMILNLLLVVKVAIAGLSMLKS